MFEYYVWIVHLRKNWTTSGTGIKTFGKSYQVQAGLALKKRFQNVVVTFRKVEFTLGLEQPKTHTSFQENKTMSLTITDNSPWELSCVCR